MDDVQNASAPLYGKAEPKDEKDEFRSFYAAYHSKEDSILKILDMIDC